MNKTISAGSEQDKNLFLCAARGLAVAVISALILALIAGLIGLSLDDPDKYTSVLALVALFASSGIGGFFTARQRGKNALLCGLVLGIFIVALMV
ncbi:MAG: TIGR04086 family membrane protein, partial [Eubacteriales bacterium]